MAGWFDQSMFGSTSPSHKARSTGAAVTVPVCVGLPLRGSSPAPPCPPGTPRFCSRRGQDPAIVSFCRFFPQKSARVMQVPSTDGETDRD